MGYSNKKSLDFIRDNYQFSQNIVAPLFNHFNVKAFGYLRIFPDWSYNLMGSTRTGEDLIEYHKKFLSLNDSSFVLSRSISEIQSAKPLYYIWPSENKGDALLSLNYESNYWHGFTIYIKKKNYTESYSFSVDREDAQMQNFFINNTGLLLEFCKYFQKNTTHIFDNAQESSRGKFVIKEIKEPYNHLINRGEMLSQLGFKETECLTTRELECLYYLANGNSAKEISRELNISPKTTENHISKIKEKTQLRKRSDLIKLYNLL